jgi:hypothetical protein
MVPVVVTGCGNAVPLDEPRGSEVTTTVSCPTTPTLIARDFRLGAADEAFLYGFGSHDLVRVPLDGGAPVTVSSGVAAERNDDLVVADDALYWIADDVTADAAIMRAPKEGGAATQIVSSNIAHRLMLAGDALYFAAGEDELWTIARDAGAGSTAQAVRNGLRRSSLVGATAAEIIFFERIDRDSDRMQLASVALAGAPVSRVDQAAASLAASTDDVFRIEPTTNVDHLIRTSRATGASTTIYTPRLFRGLDRLRHHGDKLYVATSAGQLLRMGVDGSNVEVLVDAGANDQLVIAGDSLQVVVAPTRRVKWGMGEGSLSACSG